MAITSDSLRVANQMIKIAQAAKSTPASVGDPISPSIGALTKYRAYVEKYTAAIPPPVRTSL